MSSFQLCLPPLCIPCDLKYQIMHSVQLERPFIKQSFCLSLFSVNSHCNHKIWPHLCLYFHCHAHIYWWVLHLAFAYSFSTLAFTKAIYTWLPMCFLFNVIHLPDKFVWTKFWYIEPFKTRVNNQFWFIFIESWIFI